MIGRLLGDLRLGERSVIDDILRKLGGVLKTFPVSGSEVMEEGVATEADLDRRLKVFRRAANERTRREFVRLIGSSQGTIVLLAGGADANGCTNTDTITQYVSPCTGIVGLNSTEEIINVYPNPSNGMFTLMLTRESKLIVTDVMGKLIYKANLTEGKHNLDLTENANGVYFVRVEYNNASRSIKLIKQ